jgi:hypothetical protein
LITKRKARLNRKRWARLGMENLESRLVLATLIDLNPATPVPGIFTYTDTQGDIITIRLEGTAGNAAITQVGNEVTSIAITGASPNMAISFSVDSTTNAGADGVVLMGDITSNRTIRGIYTVADQTSGDSLFTLGSFRGVSFSAGGGIAVNRITGDVGGVGLVLASLPAGTSVNTSLNAAAAAGDLLGDVTINGGFGGAINVASTAGVAGDVWTVGGATGKGAIINVGGTAGGTLEAAGVFTGAFQGGINVNGNINGALAFLGGVGRSTRILAFDVPDMGVVGTFNGRMWVGDLNLVVGGNLDVRSLITSSGDVTLAIGGSIFSGAVINADGDIGGEVGRSVNGNLGSGDDIGLLIKGGINGAQMAANGDIDLDVTGAVRGALLNGDDGVTLDLTGSIFGSTLAAGDSDVSLDVTGSVTNSSFTGDGVSGVITGSATNSVFQGSESDLSLTIGGTLTGGKVTSGSEDVELVVSGDVVGTAISAPESEVSLDVGGSMRNASIVASDLVTLRVGRGLIASTVTSTSDEVRVQVSGSVNGSVLDAGSDITLIVGGSVVNSKVFADEGGQDIAMVVTRDVRGTIVQAGSNDVTATVGGSVMGSKFFAPESSVILAVGGSLSDTDIVSGSEISLDVTGSVTRLRASATSDITLSAGGSVRQSNLTSSGSDISADIGGSLIASVLAANEDITLDVAGNVSQGANPAGRMVPSVITSSDGDLDIDIGGSLVRSRLVGDEVLAKIGLDFNGFMQAVDLDVTVGRDVINGAKIQAYNVNDLDADNIGFTVARNFNGLLDVSGAFASGTGATQTLIGGVVGATAVLNIASIDEVNSADEFVFTGNFNSTLTINEPLATTLRFGGNVKQIAISGAVLDDIIIAGRLTSLTSGSLFTAIDTNDGNFVDGLGNITGTLDTGSGHGNVTPSLNAG